MLKKIEPIAFPLVKQFYKQTRYGGAPGRDEDVWAWYQGDKLVAVVRLQPKSDDWFLRAMVVAPEHRGQGVGSQFLRALLACCPQQELWCFPLEHLDDFYRTSGFCDAVIDDAPEWYRQQYLTLSKSKRVHAMVWQRENLAPIEGNRSEV